MSWDDVPSIEHQCDAGMGVDHTADGAEEPDAVVSVDDELAVIAGRLNVVNARLVELTAGLLESGAWEQGGCRTPAAFLQWRMGLCPNRAAEVVRAAKRAASFPVLMGGFGRGELSLEQFAAATMAPSWTDADVYDFVKIATVSKIRRAMRSNMFAGDPEEPEPDPEPKPVQDRLSFGVGRDGRRRISGELDAVDGRRVEAALTERRDARFADGDERGDVAGGVRGVHGALPRRGRVVIAS